MKDLDKYFASIYLASIGDKIGFENGEREKNYTDTVIVIEDEYDNKYKNIIENLSIYMYLNFITKGCISSINLNMLMISDDTIMHLDLINAFIV